jgi:dephospho-CoA kinase
MKQHRIIGLTGGVGTGKSTVAKYLQDVYQLPILDADIYAREAVNIDTPIYHEVILRYGDRILLPDASLDRRALGEIIFNNIQEKEWLESKIHPYVIDRIIADLKNLNQETIVLVVPLLFEANMTDLVTEIWVVACAIDRQIKRLQERDRLTEVAAIIRIKNQLPLATKIAAADIVLNNDSNLDNLYSQIDIALQKYAIIDRTSRDKK